MNTHQVEAWYDGLREAGAGRGGGADARPAALLSGFLNVLLVYGFVQLAVSLPSVDRHRQTATQGKAREDGTRRELKVDSMEAKKAKKDGKR